MNVTKAIGPILGGGLIAALSAPGCYVLLVLVYSLAILPLLRLKTPPTIRRDAVSTLRFVGEGLLFCRSCQPILGVLLVTILMNCFVFPYQQLLSVFARDVLLVGPLALGILAAGDGIGSLIGSAILVTAPRLRRPGRLFIGGSVTMCACLFAFAASPVYGPALAFLILGGFFHSAFSTFQSTIILGSVDDRMRGRALGILTLAIGSTPVGMLQMGGAAGSLGAPNAVLLSTIVGAALIALVALIIPGLREYAPPSAEESPRLAASDGAR
jgi:hypothetical protein